MDEIVDVTVDVIADVIADVTVDVLVNVDTFVLPYPCPVSSHPEVSERLVVVTSVAMAVQGASIRTSVAVDVGCGISGAGSARVRATWPGPCPGGAARTDLAPFGAGLDQ